MTYPRAFSHVGISVPDIKQAVDWYHIVFGCSVVQQPTEVREGADHIGELCIDVFGRGFGSFFIAHLATADGIGIELFQFSNFERKENNLEHWKNGVYHLCFTDPDIAELARKIVESGGKQRTAIWTLKPGQPYQMVYCEDPWGTIIELYTHRYEAIYANNP